MQAVAGRAVVRARAASQTTCPRVVTAVLAASLRPCSSCCQRQRRLPGSRHGAGHAAHVAPAAPTRAGPVDSAAAAAAPGSPPTAADQPHVSVLLQEVLAAFSDRLVRRYVDGTLGAAGHACAMLQQHPELEALAGFDLDPTAHQLAAERLTAGGSAVVPVNVTAASQLKFGDGSGMSQPAASPTAYLVRSNFGRMKAVLAQLPLSGNEAVPLGGHRSSNGGSAKRTLPGTDGTQGAGSGWVGGVDAILLDLGISSMQVDTAERGFSFLRDGPLDMRMDPGAALSAEVAVNTWPEAELARVIREFGEERHWRGIARRIAAARELAPITTTQQLVSAIGSPGGTRARGGRGGEARYKHPATRTFQALRIAVNGELQSIVQALPDAIDCLAPGGRLAVITFHSLEDRIVKWAFRQAAGMAPSDEALPSYCLPFEAAAAQPSVRIVTRRPVVPGEAEQAANVRSRSAKLRVVEKL